MSAVRRLVYVVDKLCVQMYLGPSIVLVLMDSTHQLESCGRWESHFAKVSRVNLKLIQKYKKRRKIK